MPNSKVFLSHSSLDKNFVDRLASDLERISVGVWYDKWEIRVGDSIIEKIEQGMNSHDFLAIVLSPNSVESEWVKREVNAALMRELEEKKVVVLPILIADCKIPSLLKPKAYADFRLDYEKGFEDFLFSVSPENPKTVSRSKYFRTAQYLLSGLTSTDDNGTNILNLPQLRKIYPFRRELQSFLDNQQKRLLFWSAVAFERANPNKPSFMSTTTPVWGLLCNTSEEQRASWVLEGLSGVLFDYLIPFFSWAKQYSTDDTTHLLKDSFMVRQSKLSAFLEVLGPVPESPMREFLKALASSDQDIFNQIFIPNISDDQPYADLVVETSAHLDFPPSDDFYFRFLNAGEKLAYGAFSALADLHRPSAIAFLKARQEKSNKFDMLMLDKVFLKLKHPAFEAELKSWLASSQSLETQVRILVALSITNSSYEDRVVEMVDELSDRGTNLTPTLVRLYGHYGLDRENNLEKWVDRWSSQPLPVKCEAAIFSLGRVHKRKAKSSLVKLLTSKSETILAAAIETLAKYIGAEIYELLKEFSRSQSPLVRSAFYRALLHIRPADWTSYVPLAGEQNPLVRLCAARVFVHLASAETLHAWLDDSSVDDLLRVSSDEALFATTPFAPEWYIQPNSFNPELAKLSVRLTNFDPYEVCLNSGLDINRTLHFHMMGKS